MAESAELELWVGHPRALCPLCETLPIDASLISLPQKLVEGDVVAGSSCLVVEDVVTSGSSVLETCAALRSVGVRVSHAVVLLDREQGGRTNLENKDIKLTSVLTMSQLLDNLQQAGKITIKTVAMVKQFISENVVGLLKAVDTSCDNIVQLSYSQRAKLCTSPLTKRLLEIINSKCSNLALSADVSSSAELLEVK